MVNIYNIVNSENHKVFCRDSNHSPSGITIYRSNYSTMSARPNSIYAFFFIILISLYVAKFNVSIMTMLQLLGLRSPNPPGPHWGTSVSWIPLVPTCLVTITCMPQNGGLGAAPWWVSAEHVRSLLRARQSDQTGITAEL